MRSKDAADVTGINSENQISTSGGAGPWVVKYTFSTGELIQNKNSLWVNYDTTDTTCASSRIEYRRPSRSSLPAKLMVWNLSEISYVCPALWWWWVDTTYWNCGSSFFTTTKTHPYTLIWNQQLQWDLHPKVGCFEKRLDEPICRCQSLEGFHRYFGIPKMVGL